MSSARNIELKARLPDLAAARLIAQRLATRLVGVEEQTDTYFHCRHGRLKLREIKSANSPLKVQLIPYVRSDQPNAKASDYQLVDVSAADGLKQALAAALGMSVVVAKRREIFLYHNVRIHLDEVAGLGPFIEFEAVLDCEHDEPSGHARLAELQQEFGIPFGDLLSGSYADMLAESRQ